MPEDFFLSGPLGPLGCTHREIHVDKQDVATQQGRRGNTRTRWASALIAAGAAGVMPVAQAEIELGKGFSVTGFLDMSAVSTEPDEGESSESLGIDQFEIDFKFAGTSGISAQVDIEYGEGFDGSDDETFVEQAFVTKAFTEQFSVKVGRFLSYSGWETEEPTGLFQYSGAGYAKYFYGFYQNGASAFYNGGTFALMGSVVTSAFDPLDRNSNGRSEPDTQDIVPDGDGGFDLVTTPGASIEDDKFGYEVGLALMPVEGLTAKAFYIADEDTDTDVVNVWASYAASGFTFAAEYNTVEYGEMSSVVDGDGDGYLLMANYATGPYGITLRYVDFAIEDSAGTEVDEQSSVTLAPYYKVGDNLLLILEYRMDDNGDVGGPNGDGVDADTIALEALFTF
jgi:hypothetical protein